MSTPERSRPKARRRMIAVVAVLVALVSVSAGCTGVPTSSQPQIVKPLPAGDDVSQAAPQPVRRNIVPHDLVEQFLGLNAAPAGNYAAARNYLTPSARASWQNTTATVVDTATVGLFGRLPRIVVRGHVLGTIDQYGVYKPAPVAQEQAYVFRIVLVHGQYRINSLPTGLLLTESQFESSYSERDLYFFDLAQKYLVPDPRWTALSDPTQLDDWLMTQLTTGPSTLVANAVNAVPAQAGARRINVTVGTTTKIEIPGSSQLDGAARARLAAQIASTLDDSDRRVFEITDGGRPVTIPAVGRADFSVADFSDSTGPPRPAGDVYFVHDNKLVSGNDFKPVKGAVNNGTFALGSVAVSRSNPTGELAVAAVVAPKHKLEEELVLGTQSAGLRLTNVRGELARPAFAPGRDEVWVGGVGATASQIDVADLTGSTAKITPVGLPSANSGYQIIALRLSPEGSRIALVMKPPGGDPQLFIGAVVRSGGQIRIAGLEEISPPKVVVTDAGWVESTKLYVTGYSGSPDDNSHVYETDVDGSAWTVMGIGVMPELPSSFAVTPGQAAWATSGSSLWVQSGSNWQSAGPTGQTPGINPVYLG